MNCKFVSAVFAIILSLSFSVQAQEIRSEQKESYPMGFYGIQLGMSVDEVKEALKKDSRFGYRGDRDVSLLPGDARILIETDSTKLSPYSILSRCYFQFYEDRLYIITINMKNSKMDHYSIFRTLCDKYGRPTSLNPEKSEWKNDSVIMTLERPLTLKYVDKAVFDKLLNASLVNKSASEQNHDKFLEGL